MKKLAGPLLLLLIIVGGAGGLWYYDQNLAHAQSAPDGVPIHEPSGAVIADKPSSQGRDAITESVEQTIEQVASGAARNENIGVVSMAQLDGKKTMVPVSTSFDKKSETSRQTGRNAKAENAGGTGLSEINIPYEKFTLGNGLRVIVHEDRKAPLVAVSVWYHVGSKDEPEGKSGFAHLFEHLMFNGSEHFDSEWFEALNAMGGVEVNGTTSNDRTNYYQTVPTSALDRILWLESDRMGHLLGAVTQEKLDAQRGVVQNEKRQGDDRPYGKAFYRIFEGLFPKGHPYHHSVIGSMDDLNAASLEDVQEWFKEYYGPNNAVLVMAGDVDVETAKKLAEKYFGAFEPGPSLHRLRDLRPELGDNISEEMSDEVPQKRLYRVWAVPGMKHQVTAHLDLASSVLGQGKTSRLYKELVYDKQLATNVRVSNWDLELANVFGIVVTLKDGVEVAQIDQVIDGVLKKFAKEGPTEKELSRIKTSYAASYIKGLEKVGGRGGKATVLARGELYASDPSFFFDQRPKWYDKATKDEVRKAAKNWLLRPYYQLVILPKGDLEKTGEDADRNAMPKLAELPDLSFPDIEPIELSNGIKLLYAHRDAVPTMLVQAQFKGGTKADRIAGYPTGTTSFAAAMMDEGAGGLSALELSEKLDELGAGLSSGARLDSVTVSLSALSAKFPQSLDLMAKIIKEPEFSDDEIERMRPRWLAGIEQEKANPRSVSNRVLPPLLFGADHPYGLPASGTGYSEDIKALKREDLIKFHQDYIRPDNVTLFAVGSLPKEEVMREFMRAFGDWKAPEGRPVPTQPIAIPERPKAKKLVLVDQPGSAQSVIIAGLVGPKLKLDDRVASFIMNDIIGGNFTSRINMNLREDKGWSYGSGTGIWTRVEASIFSLSAPVQSDQTANALKELQKELTAYVSAEKATTDELKENVEKRSKSLPVSYETASSIMGSITTSHLYGRPLDYPESLKKRYAQLRAQDIHKAADTYIDPDRLVWIVVGDLSKIESSLRELDFDQVEVRTVEGDLVE